MRGGSIPLLAWGALLAVLMVICWIWTGDAIQVGETDLGLGHGAGNDLVQPFDVGAGRDLRYHAAKRRVIRRLRVDHI